MCTKNNGVYNFTQITDLGLSFIVVKPSQRAQSRPWASLDINPFGYFIQRRVQCHGVKNISLLGFDCADESFWATFLLCK